MGHDILYGFRHMIYPTSSMCSCIAGLLGAGCMMMYADEALYNVDHDGHL